MDAGVQYWIAVALSGMLGAAACVAGRRLGGAVARRIGRAISLVLLADAGSFVLRPVFEGGWTPRGSLPLDLCDVALVIAAIACWWPEWQLGIELTYFWGLAGTLQAVATPDLAAGFPHLEFFQFVIGHVVIVVAAVYLVVGLRLAPRPGSVPKVFAITAGYTALVGVVDLLLDANYMYLAHEPRSTSLLSVLGPWPWYIVSAAGVAIVLFRLLDVAYRQAARRTAESDPAELAELREAGVPHAPDDQQQQGQRVGGGDRRDPTPPREPAHQNGHRDA